MWPPDNELIAAWRLLVADRDTAGAFCAVVLPALEADLHRFHPTRNPDDIATAAADTLLALLRKPEAFDPTRSLPVFLRFNAGRDLTNLYRKEERHHRGRIPWETVELLHPARNDGEEGARLTDDPGVRAALATLSETDRGVFDLMRDGVRETAAFANLLGLTALSPDEQFDTVKRAKDRIKARLKRAAGEP